MTPESIDHEILTLQTVRDGSTDYEAQQAADVMIGQLREAKEALKF